ncbi:MAG TPA: glycoside hydrolase family 2 protein [Chitinophagaceae bacterium]|nr:glycoside hydrolase family 2 protein [Chitinophagaceae bacterium]
MKKMIMLLFTVGLSATATAQSITAHLSDPTSRNSVFLRSHKHFHGHYDWKIKKAGDISVGGEKISTPGYDTTGWYDAIVPGTVLNTLVANGIYPDPYYGDNNRISRHLIPDIANTGREFYHYWFRTEFTVPPKFDGRRIWLKFDGINYRCVIWLNGKKLGAMAGMFNARSFDITAVANLKGTNTLAVDVSPVDFPGSNLPPKGTMPGAKGEGHNGGDGNIGKNTTMLMSVGWDFTFPDGVRDRNTGIWRDVELFATGDVLLQHPYVQSRLPLPDTTTAAETISVECYNASDKPQKGVIRGTISGLPIHFEKTVSLKPKQRRQIVFRPSDFPQLNVTDPVLWWPVNKGPQQLYTLQLEFLTHGVVSHETHTTFGIREISSDTHTPDSSRRFLVNGAPVFIRGANWIPEAMCRNSEERTYAELRYIHQAGINFLRLWGGGIAASDYFYKLCDQFGIMVWSEFWITGNTRFPVDTALYMQNLVSTIKRIRSHASVAYYVSANESTELPSAGVQIHRWDSATAYQRESECCGVHDGSPYKYVNPMQYFENTASKRGSRVNGFNPEYGSPCLPTLSSLKQMMPVKDLWPINKAVWNYMDGGGFHLMTTRYKKAVDQYGPSSSIAEYAKKAQFVGAMNYRSIWEVWDYNKFGYGDRFASGFLFWYINSAEPQVAGRLFDWTLEPTAALYYTQNALEPLHPQFDYLKNTVSVYNDYRRSFKDYVLVANVYDLQAKLVRHRQIQIQIPADGVVNDALKLDFPKNISQVHFIKLLLKDPGGKVIASAFYWRSKDAYKGPWTMTGPAASGFEPINQLPEVSLEVHAKEKTDDHWHRIAVTVTNPSRSLAFFTQLHLQQSSSTPVTPAFYSDNFFNLLPGESKKISIEVSGKNAGQNMTLLIDGWNVKKTRIRLK